MQGLEPHVVRTPESNNVRRPVAAGPPLDQHGRAVGRVGYAAHAKMHVAEPPAAGEPTPPELALLACVLCDGLGGVRAAQLQPKHMPLHLAHVRRRWQDASLQLVGKKEGAHDGWNDHVSAVHGRVSAAAVVDTG